MIDRLYCTHCTFGTSALETASADNASKVLGYSVRASSLPDADRGRLRQVFRSIERLLSYDLPRDASAADKEALDASSAPRRLIFLPSLGDCQVVGQVCYRSHDTAGRPGSYFADLLVSRLDPRQPDAAWSPLDCLRLWAADAAGTQVREWWCESEESLASRAAEGFGKPVAPATLDEPHTAGPAAGGMLAHEASLLHDDALLAFLTHDDEAGIIRLDTGGVIPPRWRQIPSAVRRELFARMLQWTLGILDRGRENVVLAAEPSVAALLFYGVCRLLPRRLTRLTRGQPAASLGFSTYEPFPERPMTSLVATTFLHGKLANDLPAETYQRSFACNTFRLDFKYGRFTEPQAYVRRVVDLLAAGDDQGRRTLDELLEALDAMPRLTPLALDDMIRVDEFVTRYVGGTQPRDALGSGPGVKPGSDEEVFRGSRLLRLIEQGDATGRTAWPNDLLQTSIEWLGGSMAAQWVAGSSVRRVLQGQMPGGADAVGQLDRLLNSARRPPDQIADEAIASVAGTSRRLPDCIAAFLAPSRCKHPATELARIVRLIDPYLRQEVLLGSNHAVFGDVILSALKEDPGCVEPAATIAHVTEQVLCRTLEQLPCDAQLGLLVKHAALAEQVPSPPQALAQLLSLSFTAIDRAPPCSVTRGERKRSIEALQRWAYKASLQRVHSALGHWQTLLDSLQSLAEQADDRAHKRQRRRGTGSSGPIDGVVKSLAKLRPDRRDKNEFVVTEHAGPDPVIRRRSDLLATALQAIRPQPSKDSQELVMNWVDDRLKGPKRQAKQSSPGRQLAVAAMVAALLFAAVLGSAAWYGGALPEWIRRGHSPPRPSGGATGSLEDKVEPGDRAEQPEENVQDPADPRKADRLATAGATANVDSLPEQPPAVDLAIRVDGGMLFVTWNREAVKGTPHQLVISGPGLETESPLPLATVVTGSHQWKITSSGTFTAEIKPPSADVAKSPAAAGHETKTLVLPPPPTLKLTSVVVDVSQSDDQMTADTPPGFALKVAIAKPPPLAAYGPKDNCFYVLHGHGHSVGEAGAAGATVEVGRVPASGKTFLLTLPASDWPIERIRRTTFSATVDTPQGTSVTTTEGGTKPDITGLVQQGWDRARKHRIWPIRPQGGGTIAKLMELPPGVDAHDIDLVLLSPTHAPSALIKESDRPAWACSVGASKKPTDATQTAPPPLVEVGHFEIRPPANSSGRPTLVFNPTDRGDGQDNTTSLQILEMCKLCVAEAAPSRGEEAAGVAPPRKALVIAQLLSPAQADMVDGEEATNKTADEISRLEAQALTADLSNGMFKPRKVKVRATPDLFGLAEDTGQAEHLRLTFTTGKSTSTKPDSPWLEVMCSKPAAGKSYWLLWVIRGQCRVALSQPTIKPRDATIAPHFMYLWPDGLFQQLGKDFNAESSENTGHARGATINPPATADISELFKKKIWPAPADMKKMQSAGFVALKVEKTSPAGLDLGTVELMELHKKICPPLKVPPDVKSRIETCVREALEKGRHVGEYQKAIQDARNKASKKFEEEKAMMTEPEIAAWDALENRATEINKRFTEIAKFVLKELPDLQFHLDTITWSVSPPDAGDITGVDEAGGLEVIGAQRAKANP